jgi:hypothetical protein
MKLPKLSHNMSRNGLAERPVFAPKGVKPSVRCDCTQCADPCRPWGHCRVCADDPGCLDHCHQDCVDCAALIATCAMCAYDPDAVSCINCLGGDYGKCKKCFQ